MCPIDNALTSIWNLSPESDDEYSDDDDMSWKVRRSSVKCLETVISSRRDLLVDLYGSVCPTLVSCFKEREENVRTDIFLAFVALLRQTHPVAGATVVLEPGAKEAPAVTLLKKQVRPLIFKFNYAVGLITVTEYRHLFKARFDYLFD